jgi:DnaJ-class molecular chaperone
MTYDRWKTTEPDDGYRLEKCEWCNGTGAVHVVTHWHDHVQDGEAECDECGGEGRILYDAGGLPVRTKERRNG